MDDLDDLLRRAMKTLDDDVPEGYFDALPSKVQSALARSEDSSMQATGTGDSNRDASTGVPPMTKESREEDSGLHDIRSLASSTKARLSSRRSTQNPIMTEDDILASSSAGWKAVALPEPAKMISLPELADLPSAKEVKARDKAAAKAAKTDARSPSAELPAIRSSSSLPMIPAAAATATEAAPTASAAPVTSIGSRIGAQKPASGKGKTFAFVGIGLAAAAGVTLFVAMSGKKSSSDNAEKTVATAVPAAEYKSTAKMLPPPPPAAAAPADTAAAGSAATEQVAQIAAPEVPAEPAKAVATKGGEKPKQAHKVEVRDTSMTDRAEKEKAPKEEKKVVKPDGASTGGDGEPSFDALLKEAGVSDAKKDTKPKLDKKSLSGSDIKTGMAAVAGKASSCYQGTQGTATVKLTVAPSGQVSKVSVTGVFAGTPVAACVEAAVKSTSFPPWDGGPQSFGYSYLLSE